MDKELLQRKINVNFMGIKISFKLPSKIYINNLYKYIVSQTKENEIYVLLTTTGEIYLLQLLLFALKKDLDKVFFVATRNSHIQILKLFIKNPKYILLPEANFLYRENKYLSIYNDRKIYKFLPDSFIKKFFESCKQLKTYVQYIQEYTNISCDIKKEYPVALFDSKEKESLLNKMKSINLNLEKFIFISPEATTLKEIEPDFYLELEEKLNSLGYDVFYNITKEENKKIFNKTIDLSIIEANLLARMSKGIIGLRSGFCEPLLLAKDLPIIVLYSNLCDYLCNNTNLTINDFIDIYSLKNYPLAETSDLNEININDITRKDLVCKILNIISKRSEI